MFVKCGENNGSYQRLMVTVVFSVSVCIQDLCASHVWPATMAIDSQYLIFLATEHSCPARQLDWAQEDADTIRPINSRHSQQMNFNCLLRCSSFTTIVFVTVTNSSLYIVNPFNCLILRNKLYDF